MTTDTTQAEQKAVLQNDLRVRRERQADAFSYHERAIADAEIELGGRFGTIAKPVVTGATPLPRIESGPWASPDPVPDEPSLGYSVEWVEPVGTPAEIAASLVELEAPVAAGDGAPGPNSLPPSSVGSRSSINRRV